MEDFIFQHPRGWFRHPPCSWRSIPAAEGCGQVDEGAFGESAGVNSEAIHEPTRWANAFVRGGIVHQQGFELEVIAQDFHPLQADAGTPNHEESALLADSSDLSVGQRKRFTTCLE
jgi:hypothetical protein